VQTVRLLRFGRTRSIAEGNEIAKRSGPVNGAVTRLTARDAKPSSPEDRTNFLNWGKPPKRRGAYLALRNLGATLRELIEGSYDTKIFPELNR
jgi:hypothetical protein